MYMLEIKSHLLNALESCIYVKMHSKFNLVKVILNLHKKMFKLIISNKTNKSKLDKSKKRKKDIKNNKLRNHKNNKNLLKINRLKLKKPKLNKNKDSLI